MCLDVNSERCPHIVGAIDTCLAKLGPTVDVNDPICKWDELRDTKHLLIKAEKNRDKWGGPQTKKGQRNRWL